MLGTFVIGLREGLEAALVVGILATFLRRNGASLRPMWIGVVAAVLLSIGVGVTLQLVSQSLPQAAQEGMEAVISLVAIVFVTTMIVWMSSHARGLKKELEASAGDALREGTAWALAGMAFLAILKEGFETSVFLLATFQAATSTTAAVTGAVLGIAVAVALGVGIYHGGVRLNIGKFFRVTGIFLVFVAAGLVVTMLRTAHEAGWLTVGQGRTVDLSWLAPAGSVQAALVTGVLGIPAEPRVVEVLGWFLYLVPVLTLVLWPPKHRLSPAGRARFQLVAAGGLAVVALGLTAFVPRVAPYRGGDLPIVASKDDPTVVGSVGLGPLDVAAGTAGPDGSGRLTVGDDRSTVWALDTQGAIMSSASLRGQASAETVLDGVTAHETRVTDDDASADLPATVTLDQLVAYAGGRVPVGIDPKVAHGPFTASWSQRTTTDVLTTSDDVLLDASQQTRTVLTVSGGGLAGSRTLGVDAAAAGADPDWTVVPAQATAVVTAVAARDHTAHERVLWRVYLPVLLLAAAVAFAAAGLDGRRRLAPPTEATPHQAASRAAVVPGASASAN